jgi:hypothetical protein
MASPDSVASVTSYSFVKTLLSKNGLGANSNSNLKPYGFIESIKKNKRTLLMKDLIDLHCFLRGLWSEHQLNVPKQVDLFL